MTNEKAQLSRNRSCFHLIFRCLYKHRTETYEIESGLKDTTKQPGMSFLSGSTCRLSEHPARNLYISKYHSSYSSSLFLQHAETLCTSSWQTAESEKQQGWKLADWGTRKQSRGQLVAGFLLFYEASFDHAKETDSAGAVWTWAPSLTGFTLFSVMCSCNNKVTGLRFHPSHIPTYSCRQEITSCLQNRGCGFR